MNLDIEWYQARINDGTVWKFEGSIGRRAMELIEAGFCTLGEKGHYDYYGNYVPSKHEVKAGTKGSQEYADNLANNREPQED